MVFATLKASGSVNVNVSPGCIKSVSYSLVMTPLMSLSKRAQLMRIRARVLMFGSPLIGFPASSMKVMIKSSMMFKLGLFKRL